MPRCFPQPTRQNPKTDLWLDVFICVFLDGFLRLG
jgi:hypothetical protein